MPSLGRSNPWVELFAPGRLALGRSTWDYAKENADYPYYMIRDRLVGPEARSLRAIKSGDGKIIEHGGKKVAASRDDHGKLTLRSAVCTHMGCIVKWNTAERTWDCPCHGSRFKTKGDVIPTGRIAAAARGMTNVEDDINQARHRTARPDRTYIEPPARPEPPIEGEDTRNPAAKPHGRRGDQVEHGEQGSGPPRADERPPEDVERPGATTRP